MMEIRFSQREFDEHSEPDEEGFFEWAYRGWYYFIEVEGRLFLARRYIDEPDSAHFLRIERPRGSFDHIPYEDHRFRVAARHLVERLSLRALDVLTGRGEGYEAVDLDRL